MDGFEGDERAVRSFKVGRFKKFAALYLSRSSSLYINKNHE